jgi:uncharacterized membrane protein YbaN (DUF454 family)
VILGLLSFGLGIIGIIIPGLPTTPLILLSAYFFSKSSPRLHQWLLNNKYFGKYIKDYQANPSITLRIKIIAILMMWAMVLFSSLELISFLPAKIITILLGIIGTWYVGFHIPTRK